MNKIKCEMCGSNDLIKDSGVFVCQACGCKYSVDEVKKMMVEGTVDVTGTVKVDNTDKIENYLQIADSAYDSDNQKEAEEYCNKTLEIDPHNYKALFTKGKAAGWQSTLANNRFIEAVNYFAAAVKYAPDDEKDLIREQGAEEAKKLSIALISLRGKNFANYASTDNLNGFTNDRILIFNTMAKYLIKGGILPKDYLEEIADIMNVSACSAWKIVLNEFNSDDDSGHPSRYAWKRFLEEGDNCLELVKQSIGVSENDDDADIQRYKNCIIINETIIDSCSYEKQFTSYGDYWAKDYSLTAEAKKLRRKQNAEWQAKIDELEKLKVEKISKEKRERIDKYWENHKVAKEIMEKEKKTILGNINDLNKEIQSNEYVKQNNELMKKIEAKKAEIKSLKFTDFKGKKAINQEIKVLDNEKDKIQSKVSEVVSKANSKINEFQERINEIENEFKKERTKEEAEAEITQTCDNCGAEVSDLDLICPSCGAEFESSEE